MSDNTITWLHLSDFHFRTHEKPEDAYFRDKILGKLLQDIDSRVKGTGGLSLKPDFIVITGDLAFSGKEDDYKLVAPYLDKLLAITGLSKDRLFIVPGNHDVDQAKYTPSFFHTLKDSRDEATSLLLNKDDRRHLFRKFNAYNAFFNAYFGGLNKIDNDTFFYSKSFNVGTRKIAIVGLNSAWMCGSKEADNSHCLYIGDPQITDAFKELKKEHAEVKIAAFHHPFREFQQKEQKDLEAKLTLYDYVLTGHLHDTSIKIEHGPAGELFCVTAGSCYERKDHSDAYNIVKLDYNEKVGKAYFRIRVGNAEHWVPDTITFEALAETNGIYSWPLKEHTTVPIAITTSPDKPLRRLAHKFEHTVAVTDSWAGRARELADITRHYKEGVRVVSLEGFGGMGKSTLAKKWYEVNIEENPDVTGFLWWSFYQNRNVEDFFNTALEYVSDGECKTNDVTGYETKKDKMADYLRKGNFVFVLDGMEDIQKSDATGQHGELENKTMRCFLELWADGKIPGFCLISTRYPLPDLKPYKDKSYIAYPIENLEKPDAVQLLLNLGVTGDSEDFDKIYKDYEGHALSLNLLGGYLVSYWDGLAKNEDKIKFLDMTAEDNKSKKILLAYETKLTDPQKAFMQILSCFLGPVTDLDFSTVFRKTIMPHINKSLAGLNSTEFKMLLAQLEKMRLIGKGRDQEYSAHPLIKHFFEGRINPDDRTAIYKSLYYYMGKIAPNKPSTVNEMTPIFGQVSYGCRAGMYDNAYGQVYVPKIMFGEKYFLVKRLGAWATNLEVLSNFFPNGDFGEMPLLSKVSEQGFLINGAALAMNNLGRLAEAEGMYRKFISLTLSEDAYESASLGYYNLAELLTNTGSLNGALDAANDALSNAEKANSMERRIISTAFIANISFLLGIKGGANKAFEKANELEIEYNRTMKYPCSDRGIHYADFLLAYGETEKALSVNEENINFCENKEIINDICQCHRLIASIFRVKGKSGEARQSIETAQAVALKTDRLDVKLQVVLEQGRVELAEGKHAEAERCFIDCRDRAARFGYRLFEADARNGLAKVYMCMGREDVLKSNDAMIEAKSALDIANDTGYFWAKNDAEEILSCLI